MLRWWIFLASLVLAVDPVLAANPKNCGEAAMAGRQPGDTLIEPRPGVAFTVYCYWGPENGNIPREYLTLVRAGGNYNFGQYTAGVGTSGTTVRTSFTKIRLDPASLKVDIGDTTFATSTGSLQHGSITVTQMPLGTAMDCYYLADQSSVANIDLTGTPFEIASGFWASGWGSGTVEYNGTSVSLPTMDTSVVVQNTREVTVRGGGACGSAGPYGYSSNVWEAIVPGSKLALQIKFVGP